MFESYVWTDEPVSSTIEGRSTQTPCSADASIVRTIEAVEEPMNASIAGLNAAEC